MYKKGKVTTHHLVTISLLSAVAYALMFVGRVPMIAFLKYEPKDVIIMISGMAFGPAVTVVMSIVVSVVEFMTVSSDGIIGLFMNVLSTVAYATLATIIYKRTNTTRDLIIGLFMGTILTTVVMVAWNYVVTPFYLGIPREAVVGMLVPVIIPFNLIKYSINSGIILLIQRPILKVFKRSKIIDREVQNQKSSIYLVAIILIVSSLILVSLINNI